MNSTFRIFMIPAVSGWVSVDLILLFSRLGRNKIDPPKANHKYSISNIQFSLPACPVWVWLIEMKKERRGYILSGGLSPRYISAQPT